MMIAHPSRPDYLLSMAQSMQELRFYPEEKQVSVTTLLKPAHMVRLHYRHQHEVVVDPVDMIPAMVGIAWHNEMYRATNITDEGEVWKEAGYHAGIAGWTLTGIVDWHDGKTLRDYKTARMWSRVFGRREWEEQLNLYRWLLWMNGHKIEDLEIHAVYLDWSENQVKRNEDFPRERFEVIPIRAWPFADTEIFIKQRLKALEKWDGICNPEERWERDEHWAVKMKGRIRALKRCTTLMEAEDFCHDSPELYVEHRPGTPTRCQRYCPVKEFCSFGRNV